MKKNILGVFLTATLTLSALAGCTPSTGQTTSATTTPTTTSAEVTTPATQANSTTSGVTSDAVETRKVFVSPQWVQSVIDGNQPESANYVIWEVAWGEEKDSPGYGVGHIKGAVHMNTDNLEEPENWNIRKADEIEALLKQFGVTQDTTVIVYADSPVNSADDRAALALLWAGVKNVKSLDGGMEAWVKAGYETETTSNAPVATDKTFGTTIPAHPEYLLSLDQVKENLKDENFKLVSIRSKDEFLGLTSGYSYIPKAGEPKGAIWGHDTDDGSYNKPDGTTIDSDTLEGFLKESGASLKNDLSFYCGTGWRAAIPFLVAYEEGMDNISVYDGGWFVWQKQDDLDVQVGDPQSADVKYLKVGDLPADKARK